ncbi:hypothetical protein [Methylobacterium sp. UNC378MF]|uniref:hypothetical protein n=1 Tax=Methylobacterium sp. UNC378MF TaxID=1502748 RepID=UPI001FCD9D4F|nr:hypothetical protein [Methylobacterium sp. UNC378MF]
MTRADPRGRAAAAPGRRGRADPRVAPARSACALARIVALLALYALALQGILGGLVSADAGSVHILCLADDGQTGPAPAGKHLPAHHRGDCCVACQAAGPAALPAPSAATAIPVARPVVAAGPRPQRVALPRAPPRPGLGARAPPDV